MTRAMVVVEMQWLNNNGLMEFKDMPGLQTVCDMISGCQWSDKLVELQLWTRVAYVAFEAKDHAITTHTALQALRFAESGTTAKGKRPEP